MRIQHNIPAMNAYRNYNNNTKALQGNLQKLSSGYKINKAGDDAAGLAISEKMRAQITGLEVAQKNAKDGISLVQTAEGALTEVHTMLNRMYSLAEQSANGTYADEVDREQLQKEVVSLRDEINRIADASNFNGKKLLDGSLAGGGGNGKSVSLTDSAATTTALTTAKATAFSSGLAAVASATAGSYVGDTMTLTFNFEENGKSFQKTIELKTTASGKMTADSGTAYTGTATGITNAEVMKAVAAELNAALGDSATFTENTGALQVAAKEDGSSGLRLTSMSWVTVSNGATTQGAAAATTTANTGTDTKQTLTSPAYTGTGAASDFVFEVNGKKYALATDGNVAAFDKDVRVFTGANSIEAAKNAAAAFSKMGMDVTAATGALVFSAAPAKASGGLTLQIGDTSDDYNKMTVSIDDMHADAMGIGDIDIGTEDGASVAMTAIKDAINYVSNTRGTLGSLQNRLDHTISNLAVQQENIQDAEATIRDVDVANEMMAYTKNNILVQSAQAMLAQANQLPQGVLQLLG